MYAPMSSPFRARNVHSAGAYHAVGVQTDVAAANPHQLIALLFDAWFVAVNRARAAIEVGDIEARIKHIDHAIRLVDEGLKAGLDLKAGGKLAGDLADLYRYITVRLAQANLRVDADALQECLDLMQPLREAWTGIAPQN